jgi:hypothetical protein
MADPYGTAEPPLKIAEHTGLLEIGRRGYWPKQVVKLPPHMTFAEAEILLVCSNCGQRNAQPGGYPLWIRPDSRVPPHGQLGFKHTPQVIFEGRNEMQQANFSSCGSMLGCGRRIGLTTEPECRELPPAEGFRVRGADNREGRGPSGGDRDDHCLR